MADLRYEEDKSGGPDLRVHWVYRDSMVIGRHEHVRDAIAQIDHGEICTLCHGHMWTCQTHQMPWGQTAGAYGCQTDCRGPGQLCPHWLKELKERTK